MAQPFSYTCIRTLSSWTMACNVYVSRVNRGGNKEGERTRRGEKASMEQREKPTVRHRLEEEIVEHSSNNVRSNDTMLAYTLEKKTGKIFVASSLR